MPLIELENQWNQAECSEENIQKGSDKIKQKVAMASLNKCWPVEKAIQIGTTLANLIIYLIDAISAF